MTLGLVTVLLLSGGVGSAAVAAWRRPQRAIFIDYGQPAAGRAKAASAAIASYLGIEWEELAVDLGPLGVGGLTGRDAERWPYRNQLLITMAAVRAQKLGERVIMLGSVRDDDAIHDDDSSLFYRRSDQLLRLQQGGLRIVVPALGLTRDELVAASGVSSVVLDLTYACEQADGPCGRCAGCLTRANLLTRLSRAGGLGLAPRQR
jgi:7-cyano-7-deazaguanine synthase